MIVTGVFIHRKFFLKCIQPVCTYIQHSYVPRGFIILTSSSYLWPLWLRPHPDAGYLECPMTQSTICLHDVIIIILMPLSPLNKASTSSIALVDNVYVQRSTDT